MKKFKLFLELEKEEEYLNNMAREGYNFEKCSAFGVFHFSKGEKKETNYRMDYRIFKTKREFETYKTMFADFGWKHVCGSKYSGNQYFIPEQKEIGDELFSSKESEAARYKRCYEMSYISMLVGVIYFVITISTYKFNLSNFLFLTPGLWERTGFSLVRGILFELPFVVLRVVPVLFLVAMSLYYAIVASKLSKIYKSKIQKNDTI